MFYPHRICVDLIIKKRNFQSMITHNAKMTTTLGLIAVIAVASMTGLSQAFAEGETKYKMADDVQAIFTFEFRDGVEVIEFPVFKMAEGYVNKNISPSFSVEGVVGPSSPHLHKALDDAFKYKQNPGFEWNYKLFKVNVDFVKNGTSVKTLPYHDCYVVDYKVKTLTDDYESYMSSKTGFSIIDDIDFTCGGLKTVANLKDLRQISTNAAYVETPFDFAGDVRAFVTFEFDEGIEVIEFPYFQTNDGFEESTGNVVPGFSVESTIKEHPLLDKAIQKARSNGGLKFGANTDFEATVDFKKGDQVLRTLEYRDCRVADGKITTLVDKEEGFTGKSGFAIVEEVEFLCIGLHTVNHSFYDFPRITKTSLIETTFPSHEYPLGKDGPRAVATFTYDHGVEVIDFPIFDQGDVLVKSGPTFELEGVVGDYPMLYEHVEDNLTLVNTTGANNFLNLFQVDIELINDGKVVRGFNYVDCRVTDYDVKTQRDKEESYFKGFAHSNTFDFTCQGYHPNSPIYDALFTGFEKAQTINTTDLRDTHDWDIGFYVQ